LSILFRFAILTPSAVFEACKLGDSVFLLPALVFDLERAVLASLFSQETWDALEECDRERLRKFLPSPPSTTNGRQANNSNNNSNNNNNTNNTNSSSATSGVPLALAAKKAWQEATLRPLFDTKRRDFPLGMHPIGWFVSCFVLFRFLFCCCCLWFLVLHFLTLLGVNPVLKFVDDLFNGQYNASIAKYKDKIMHYRYHAENAFPG
jgi:hypothetical protein